ncbi:hypothetical protein ACJQWK_11212 [Exserohilum turcicum]|uniref:Uncharacterized protein n=1 Tax=Exserohilum turcicum (strain 28A) TaxID=671987 RepID=R0KDI1_EXST2|nr:uncharacterized protein SETTUDRAFT_166836 [Exserohilum turcica Et28A]EOA90963.1 hypothetical protein SETTUDRAFT_166836 [Exserohilum turcica Et28A]
MQFSAAVAALALMASSAAAQIQLENVASFETYSNTNCSPPASQQQNINSNDCKFLPQQSARVFFLEKNRANCQLQFFTSSDCTGTPTDIITSAPSACLDVSTKFSFKAICS